MYRNKSYRTKNHTTNTGINDHPAFPSYFTGCRAATTPVPKTRKLPGVVPHEGYTSNPSTNPTKISGGDLKNKLSRSGRVQSVSSPPVDGRSPSSFVVESNLRPAQFPSCTPSLRRSVARGGACLRAPAFRLSISAPPLLPKKTRESEVIMPNAPRTTQLYRHA